MNKKDYIGGPRYIMEVWLRGMQLNVSSFLS